MKIACLFAGQGAQYPGMGRDLYEKYEKSRRVFDEAGEKIKQLCFEGTAEELKLTENTQPGSEKTPSGRTDTERV